MDYESAAQLMELHASRARGNKLVKKLKYHTTLRVTAEIKADARGGVGERFNLYVLKYFDTDIITYHYNHIEIHDGGFFSRSTHDRLNEYMPPGFSVSGATYQELGLHRPLGFLKTPRGEFPYKNRMHFNYEGAPYLNINRPYFAARRAVEELPAYVDGYLDTLFNGGECTVNTSRDADAWWLRGEGASSIAERSVSTNAGNAIINKTTFRYLARLAGLSTATEAPNSSLTEGLNGSDLGLLLAHNGFAMFKKPITNAQLAQRFEHVLEYNHSIPNINKQYLRAYLRRQLFKFLIERLGFSEVTWNRR